MADGRRQPALQAGGARLRALLTDPAASSSMPATSLVWNPRTSWKTTRRAGEAAGPEGRSRRPARRLRSARSGPPGRARCQGLSREGVGIRLEPYDLAEPGRLGRFNVAHVPFLGRASAGRATRVKTPVGGDPVQPGAQRGGSSNPPRPCQAASSVSCRASSASWKDPSIR